jgi:outer membrane lipopolysaccharide assembly protein LptE/RlpB
MVRQIMLCAVLAVVLAGCGTWEVERLAPVSKLSCVKVADVTASSPAAAEIIREQLRAELQKNGLNVTDDCEYKLVISWDAQGSMVVSSRVTLSDNKKTLIVWTYRWDFFWDVSKHSPIDFARDMAWKIAKEVK